MIVLEWYSHSLSIYVPQQRAEIWVVLRRPMGLNSPVESEFQFFYFIFLRCPSGILRDLIT